MTTFFKISQTLPFAVELFEEVFILLPDRLPLGPEARVFWEGQQTFP